MLLYCRSSGTLRARRPEAWPALARSMASARAGQKHVNVDSPGPPRSADLPPARSRDALCQRRPWSADLPPARSRNAVSQGRPRSADLPPARSGNAVSKGGPEARICRLRAAEMRSPRGGPEARICRLRAESAIETHTPRGGPRGADLPPARRERYRNAYSQGRAQRRGSAACAQRAL